MARRKNVGVIELPSGVHAVRAGGKIYYYWHPHRGTSLEGKRISLGTDPRDPVFWEKLKAAQGKASGGVEPWTFAALALAYRGPEGGVGSADWEKNEPNTKRMWNLYIDRIIEKWGGCPSRGSQRARFMRFANCTKTGRQPPISWWSRCEP